MALARKLAERGEPEHARSDHPVCEKCRCKKVAGQGTKGDFYGLGEDTGHFGVGFCSIHEKGRNASHAAEYARNQMQALQLKGRAQNLTQERAQLFKENAEVARNRMEIQQGMELIKGTLQEFRSKCMPSGKDGYVSSGLRERGGKGGDMPLTDKSRMELACKLATTISTLAKDEYAITKDDMLTKEQVAIAIHGTIILTIRYLPTEEQRAEWLEAYAAIWEGLSQ